MERFYKKFDNEFEKINLSLDFITPRVMLLAARLPKGNLSFLI